MHAYITAVAQNIIFQGAVSGFLAAAIVDFRAFQSWKNVHDAVTYNWNVALWRWFQGAVVGAATASSLFSLF